MNYLLVKHLHMTCAVLSITLFVLRGGWTLSGSPLMQQRWVRILPHIVDTLLLGSALTLVMLSGLYPFVQPWLTAKVLALCVYIVLGSLALKRAKTKGGQALAMLAALLTVAYIVAVALTKNPVPWS
jgi:uncharacterized membrane protein SirB2